MRTLSASLKLRPTRIGFLVEPQDSVSLRKILQTCACLWGGVFNPIIPVCTSLPDAWRDRHRVLDPTPNDLATGYVAFFEPDVFVEAQQGLADSIGISKKDIDFGHPRVLPLDAFFEAAGRHEGDVPFGTNIFHVYEDLYEREFKFVPRHERRVAIFEADATNASFVAATFGEFPKNGPLAPLSKAYVDAFDPVKLALTAENWIKVIKEGFELPLHFTRKYLKRDPDGWSEPTIFVVDPSSTLDLIDLWNIRQFHPQILAVDVAWLQEAKEFIAEFVKLNHRPLPGNPHGVMIHTTIQFGRSISEDHANEAVADSGLTALPDAPWSFKLWYDSIWQADRSDLIARPRRALVSAATNDLELSVDEDGPDLGCRFRSLAPEFAPTYGDGAARWVNVLEFNNYGTNDTLALTMPLTLTDEGRCGLRIGEATIISREGFVLPQHFKEQGEYFRLLTGQKAVIDWLKTQGVDAQASDPGRIADQILASLKGFWGARLIADRETIMLLDEMSKSVRKYVDGKLEEFPDRSIDVKRWKDLVHRRANATFGRRVSLDAFIKAKVLRLGLVLECTNCRKTNWFGIGTFRELLTCERCLNVYDFPQGTLNFDRTPWQYRVVGPYSVPNYAQGAYAIVLALTAFAKGLGSDQANISYATSLDFKIGDANPFEVDFTFWYQRKRILDLQEEPVLVFGEAKSFAVESFKQDDIERMWKLAKKFPGAFLVFATLKDSLTDVEKAEISRLATWGRERLRDGRPRAPVIVLASTELFSTWNIEHTWKDLGDRHAKFVQPASVRLDNLWTLAEITQQLYLGLPHRRAHLLQRAQPKSA
ncbi:MAG: hypothetical protein WAQ52_12590 [Terriglobales bacterium]